MATDDFNRANEAPLASPWVQVSGSTDTLRLVSNAITTTGGSTFRRLYYLTGAASSPNQYAQAVQVTAPTPNQNWGPAARIQSDHSYYGVSAYNGSDGEIYKYVAGTYTSLLTNIFPGDIANGDVVGIQVEGSIIRAVKNGVVTAWVTDTSISTAGLGVGFGWWEPGGSVDNFEGGNYLTDFPTTSVLTNFTGSDENPLSEGGAWSGSIEGGAEIETRRVSNAVQGQSGGASGSYRVGGSFTEAECYMTISTVLSGTDNHYMGVAARIADPDTAGHDLYLCYYLTTVAGPTVRLQRVVNGAFTELANVLQTLTNGNKLGISVSGTGATVTIKGYVDTGSGWVEVVAYNDTSGSRLVAPGTIGFKMSHTTIWIVDDFGGGEIISAAEKQTYYGYRRRSYR